MAYLNPRIDPRELEPEELPPCSIGLDISTSVRGHFDLRPDEELTPAHIMAYTQRSWVLSPAHANENAAETLIFSCAKTPDKRRQIIGVFKFGRSGNDSFVHSPWGDPDNRYVFLAEPAPEAVWNRYVGLFLPALKPGEANPVKYFEQ